MAYVLKSVLAEKIGLLLKLGLLCTRRDLLLVVVTGHSMEPALIPGDRLICSRSTVPTRDAIVVRTPKFDSSRNIHHVKRLIGLAHDHVGSEFVPSGMCWLEGDNAAMSTDSRQVGPVPWDEIEAVAIANVRRHRLRDLGRRAAASREIQPKAASR